MDEFCSQPGTTIDLIFLVDGDFHLFPTDDVGSHLCRLFVLIHPNNCRRNHHRSGKKDLHFWEDRLNTVLLSIFVGMALNLVEKIIIQFISLSFHTRTYEDRITVNKFQVNSLAKLYAYSRENLKIGMDPDVPATPTPGMRTPRLILESARVALTKFGDVMGKVAGDFTGRAVETSASPKSVVITLLSEKEGTLALARRLFRTFSMESDGTERVTLEGLQKCLSEEEAEATFQMFDRDLNGDISCEEMELACRTPLAFHHDRAH